MADKEKPDWRHANAVPDWSGHSNDLPPLPELKTAVSHANEGNSLREVAEGAIAVTEFWRSTAVTFRRLQPPPPKPGEVQHASHNGLCAWWVPDGWHDGKAYRFFDDGHDIEANKNIERLFWNAAESAGVELGYPGGEVAVFAWLDRLRLEGLYVTGGTLPGSLIIHRVCDASAEYCVKCESDAKVTARSRGKNGKLQDDVRPQMVERVTLIGLTSRAEIETYADDAFAVACDRLIESQARREYQATAQARRSGNSGAYVPALIDCAAQAVHEVILARADAWVEAFTLFGVPSDVQAHQSLETAAKQIGGGAISGVRGKVQLAECRTKRPLADQAIYLNGEIEKTIRLALKEGKLRLKRQRIEASRPRNAEPTQRTEPAPKKETPRHKNKPKQPDLKAVIKLIERWRINAGEDGGKLKQELVADKIGISPRAYHAAKAGKPRGKDHHGKVLKFARDKGLIEQLNSATK
jgi:hypothetical protein